MKERKSKRFDPSRDDCRSAMEEYLKNGGKVTKIEGQVLQDQLEEQYAHMRRVTHGPNHKGTQ